MNIDFDVMSTQLLNSLSFRNQDQNKQIVIRYLKQAYNAGDNYKWCDDLDDLVSRLKLHSDTGSV